MRTQISFSSLALLLLTLPAAARGDDEPREQNTAARVDFAREILPILSNKCFVCHGPDGKRRLVRLDSRAGATRDLGGYRAIDPDAPEDSEILARLSDPDDPMPPKDAEKQITATERELLRRWVLQGGDYATHWAFVPPRKQRPPATRVATDNAIDAFLLSRLEERDVGFAPPADRATLARRVALVLTGLPPEPDQLAAFLADERADAYERFVDEMLASPRFGEHQARYWLDAVRYGDTHGLHLDNRRGIYPYRDWVVRAFNENLPLDQFITWQLAGDLLDDPTLEQRVATGFVRMNPTTSEGGVLPEEFQAKNNFDRTETLGTVLLGMSLTCARCHTHKFDPIPQTEYYRLLAFFQSTAERPLDGNSYTYAPVIKAPRNQTEWTNWVRLETARDELLARINDDSPEARARLVEHATAQAGWTTEAWRISKPVPADAPAPDEASLEEVQGLPGKRKDKLPEKGQAIWTSFRLSVPTEQVLWLTFTGGSGSRVLVDGSALSSPFGGWTDDDRVTITLTLTKGPHEVDIKLAGGQNRLPIEIRVESAWTAVARSRSWEASNKDDRLRMLAEPIGPFASLGVERQARTLSRRIEIAREQFTTSLVAEELPKPRPTRVLARGEYNQPKGDPLEPGVLTVMGSFPDDAPRNRLGLARWLTSRRHPLVARVLINRVWQRTFGDGLVRTPEDFGLQGQQPTHPQLLDWLAVELQDSGWDLKHMLRLMVTSQAFRQDSGRRADIDDPENRLWARGPRFRLDAEVIRDLALWASGLLDPVMGGEGVKPYQPGGLWFALAHPASNTKRYVRDHDHRIYRRSLYVYWKRTSPHPMMTLFDAPSREASCVKRSRTDTPLQSLALFNETQRLEMARVFAERLLRSRDQDAARLDLLFTLLACRAPSEGERAACTKLLTTLRRRYSESEEDALALLSTGDAPRDETLAPAEHAAWAQLVITVLASDVALLLY